MMQSLLLSGDDVNTLVDAMTAAGLDLPDRAGLFSGLPKGLKSRLATTNSVDAQLRSDLEALNDETTRGELQQYLKNAASIAAHRRRTAALLTYAARYVDGTPGPNPDTIGSLIEVLFEQVASSESPPPVPARRGIGAIAVALVALLIGAWTLVRLSEADRRLDLFEPLAQEARLTASDNAARIQFIEDTAHVVEAHGPVTHTNKQVIKGIPTQQEDPNPKGLTPVSSSRCLLSMVYVRRKIETRDAEREDKKYDNRASCAVTVENGHWELRVLGGKERDPDDSTWVDCAAVCIGWKTVGEVKASQGR